MGRCSREGEKLGESFGVGLFLASDFGTYCSPIDEVGHRVLAMVAREQSLTGTERLAVTGLLASTVMAVIVGGTHPAAVLRDTALQAVEHVGESQRAISALPRIRAGTEPRNAHSSSTAAVLVVGTRFAAAWDRALVQNPPRTVEHGVFCVIAKLGEIFGAGKDSAVL